MDDQNRTNGNTGRTPRVRSRTVLLTSDMAGQVRSRLSAGARENSFNGAGEEPQKNENFERREAPVEFERHGDATTVTQRPSFQSRPTFAEQQPNVEEEVPSHLARQQVDEEIPSHLTRQRMEEAEREMHTSNEPYARREVIEQPAPESETYSTVESAIPNRRNRFEQPVVEQARENRAPVRPEVRAESKPAPQMAEYVEDTNPGQDRIVWSKDGALIGFLISYDKNPNGTVFELRTGRLIVTSEFAGTGNFLYLNDQTVSPMHAILRCGKGTPIQVLDQLSECGTKIVSKGNKDTKELAGDKGSLKHGDTVFFGERSFKVCLIDE